MMVIVSTRKIWSSMRRHPVRVLAVADGDGGDVAAAAAVLTTIGIKAGRSQSSSIRAIVDSGLVSLGGQPTEATRS